MFLLQEKTMEKIEDRMIAIQVRLTGAFVNFEQVVYLKKFRV